MSKRKMIEVREAKSDLPMIIFLDGIKGFKDNTGGKVRLYMEGNWFFDVKVEYKTLKNFLKNAYEE